MKKITALFLALMITFLCACSLKNDSTRFKEYTDEYFLSSVISDGFSFTSTLKYPENFGIKEYPVTLGRYSVSDPENAVAAYTTALSELEEFDREKLTEEQKLIYDMLKDNYSLGITASRFKFYSEPLNAYSGIHTNLLLYFSELEIDSVKRADMYIALLGDVDEFFSSIEDFEKKKSQLGLFMSDENCDAVIAACRKTVDTIENNAIYSSFDEKIFALDIEEEKKLLYIAEQKRLINDEVIPAYESLIDTMTSLKGTGHESGAVCNMPNGTEYYSYLLKARTGTDKSVDEIKQMLDEDIKTYSEIFYDTAASYPELYDAEGYGMKYAVSEPEQIMNYLREAMSQDYPDIPDFSANIKYMTSGGNPALYLNAAIDDAGNAVIYINSEYYGGQLYPTVAHEGIPGHLYEHYYFTTKNPEPIRYLLSSNGYVEGWGAYVERESYKYAGENESASVEMVTANSVFVLSLITRVDIGVNYDGWSLDETEKFFSENGISTKDAEYYYYLVMKKPAQYLPYYVGWREITDLRSYAEEQLGTYFSLKDFHTAILDAGPVPLKFLRGHVDRYIETELEEHKR